MKQVTLVCSVVCSLVLVAIFARAEIGVTDTEILLGESLNVTGSGNERPLEMKRASDLVFKKINAAGGIFGRKIVVKTYDDQYKPELSIENAKKLVETDKVFSLYAFFGAAHSKAVMPYSVEKSIPFIFPASGVEDMRSPVKKNVFNVRLSYAQETEELVRYAVEKLKLKKIAIFYQDDALGIEGKNGTLKALSKRGLKLVAEAQYKRNTEPSAEAYNVIKAANPEVVIMSALYNYAGDFAKRVKADGKKWVLMGPTPLVGPAFVKAGGEAAEGTLFANGFPSMSQSLPIAQQLQEDLKAFDVKESVNIEGYLNALVLVEGLKNAGKNLTRESLIAGLEKIKNKDFGGVKISYSPQDHQGLKSAFMTQLKGGKYEPVK